MLNGVVTWDKDAWIPLNDIDKIEVMPEEQVNSEHSANGHPAWNSRVEPTLFVVKVSRFVSDDKNWLVFLAQTQQILWLLPWSTLSTFVTAERKTLRGCFCFMTVVNGGRESVLGIVSRLGDRSFGWHSQL